MGEFIALEAEMARLKDRLDAIEGLLTPEALAKSFSERMAKAKADKAKAKEKAEADEAAKAKADARVASR